MRIRTKDPGEPVIVLLYALGCLSLFGARCRHAAMPRGRQASAEGSTRPSQVRPERSTRPS